MWLRKETGGTQIGPHEWPTDGSVTEVPDQLGRELLAIPEGGFEKADGPDPAPELSEAPDGQPSGEITEGSEPPAGAGGEADGPGPDPSGEPSPDGTGGEDADDTKAGPDGESGAAGDDATAPGSKRRTGKTAAQK